MFGSSHHTYDALYRLTRERTLQGGVEERVVTYTYDLVGNRLTKTDSAYEWYEYESRITYTYDAQDRLLVEDGADYYAGDVTYTYDANGRTLTRVDSEHGTTTTYTWDIAGRMVGATIVDSSGTKQLTYTYDSDGMRTGAAAGGQETTSLIDKQQVYDQVLEEYAPGGALAATYVHGLDLIFQDRQGTRSSYHADGLGSVRALSNAAGAVTDTYTYDAYGQVIGRTGTTANDYQFTGEQYDANLEQTYLRARYYDAAAGRFSRMDTYEGRINLPMSLHKYAYASQNPVDNVDPSGLETLAGIQVALGQGLQIASYGIRIGEAAAQGVQALNMAIMFYQTFFGGGIHQIRQAAENVIRQWGSVPTGTGTGLLLQQDFWQDVLDVLSRNSAKIVARMAAVHGNTILTKFAQKTAKPFSWVIYMPTPDDGQRSVLDKAIPNQTLPPIPFPGFMIGTVPVLLQFGGGGGSNRGRLFGIGILRTSGGATPNQFFRMDYHIPHQQGKNDAFYWESSGFKSKYHFHIPK